MESLSISRSSARRFYGNRVLWMIVGLVISLGLAWYLLQQVELEQFLEVASRVSPWSLVLAFALYVLLNYWRAVRFRIPLKRAQAPLHVLFPITLYHNFLVRTLPFRTGELAYVTLMRQYLGQSVSEGFGSLLGARLFELLLVIIGGLAGLLISSQQLANQAQLVLAFLIGGFFGCLVIIYFAGPVLRRLTRFAMWLVQKTPWQNAKPIASVEQKLQGLAVQLDRLREPRMFVSMLLISVCTYGTNAIFYMVVMTALGVNQSIGIMLPIISLGMLASFFPLSFLELGVVESGFTFGIVVLAGLDMGQAVPIAFFLHGFQMICAALTGLVGYLGLQFITPP
jgi:uncharacterized protein (TIRG00374 family)